MRKINNKGFTLIELLAVIVIMGILMVVAIPAMTGTINNSRKDSYYNTAASYISSARYSLINGEFKKGTTLVNVPDGSNNGSVCIPLKWIKLDTGGEASPYGIDINKEHSYVTVAWDTSTKKVLYKVFLEDTAGNFVGTTTDPVLETELTRSSVTKGTVVDALGTGCTSMSIQVDGENR